MERASPAAVLTLLTLLTLTACAGYYTPTLSSDPDKMGDSTLCFRHASTKNPALANAIARRGLDCTQLLDHDPLYQSRQDIGAATRSMR